MIMLQVSEARQGIDNQNNETSRYLKQGNLVS